MTIFASIDSVWRIFNVLIISILAIGTTSGDESPSLSVLPSQDGDSRPRSERILSDSYFFDVEFGAEQIVKLKEFVAIKQRENFLTTGRFDKKPKLNEISQRYGAPDLVVATKEFYLDGDDARSYTVTAFYDRVGFSVYGKHHRSQTVHVVTLQYHDFTAAKRPAKGNFFYEVVTTKNRIFYSEGKEVGLHIYTDRMAWETLGAIPAGKYLSLGQPEPYSKVEIDARGSGNLYHYFPNGSIRQDIQFADGKYHGQFQEFSDQGWVEHESSYEEGRMHGKLRRFYENGLKQAEASYYHGRIHGRAQEFHPNGTVKLKMDYAYGNPISSLQEFDESGKLTRSSEHPESNPTPNSTGGANVDAAFSSSGATPAS
ncbi:MAG: hypothetical protein ACI9R3_003244 [Verrucomicrobiales bacterium]|jgi:hypothetical protein